MVGRVWSRVDLVKFKVLSKLFRRHDYSISNLRGRNRLCFSPWLQRESAGINRNYKDFTRILLGFYLKETRAS